MTSYSEHEICRALNVLDWKPLGWSMLKKQLDREAGTSRVHDLTGDDMVAVKEIEQAHMRLAAKNPLISAGARLYLDEILRDISESRGEPEYPYASVWKDADGITWFRYSDKTWMRFGYSERFPHARPKRPLERMNVAR